MMDQLIFAATLLAALGAGLVAGSFFAFSAYTLPALRRLPPAAGITAMQSIIAAIKTPLFLVVFFGTATLAGLLGLAAPLEWSKPGALYLLIGSLLYLNGPFGVTLMKNLPLNNKLAAAKPGSAEGAKFWQEFLSSWSIWNHIRTVMSLAACASFIVAMVEGGSPLPARE